MTTDVWLAIERSAIAPGTSSVGTSSGVIAPYAGHAIELPTPVSAASARNGHSCRAPCSVTTSSSADTVSARTSPAANMRRRGNRSVSWPIGSASSGSGLNSIRPINPRSSGSRWIANTCQPMATATMFSAKRRQRIAAHSCAKLRMRSGGGRRRITVGRLGSAHVSETHDTTQAKLEWLQELRGQALHAGSESAVAKRREAGRLLARERAEQLCDPGSFVELDRYVRHRESNFGMMDRRPYGDAVVTGYGTIFGRKIFVFSQDFTVFGGSLSEVFAEKICKVMDLAVKFGCPVIGINDSGGARIQEGVVSLAGYAEIFWRNVQASGVVPQLSLIMGPCAGGAVYSPAITDFVLMVEGTSYMFITGPDVVKAVTGEDVSFEDLGGAAVHASKSGVAQFIAPDDETCLEDARYLLSFLPQNNLESPAYAAPSDPVDREDAELDTVVPDNPNKPYDIRQVVQRVVDDGDFVEVHERYAENLVCGFARLGGHAVGVVGNQPHSLAGVLDSDASVKGARFVRTCDAFNIPLVTFVDVPGFLPGTAQEW